LVFQQTAAPTGWTKESSATYNDAALRFTTGTVGTGGADAFNTLFGTSKSSAAFTLTTAEEASHVHQEQTNAAGSATVIPARTWVDNTGGAFTGVAAVNNTQGASTAVVMNTVATGGGGSHSHTLSNFDLKWADCIIASKD